ncbi:MAG: nucleotide-binding protein [Chloroflexi bacterium]|nr:nucleotide-binding protein [Chloroflexota bacterium]
MRIGITGSWRDKDREAWGLRSDLKSFKDACHQLGLAIAQSGAAITVGSDSDFTADKYAVEGYLSSYSDALSVRIVRPQKGPAPFPDLYNTYPKAFVYLTGPSSTWRHTRQQFVSDVDALVTVGGADGTYQAALELRLTRKRLVPVGAFGGASSRLLAELLYSGTLREAENFERLSNPWTPHLATHVVTVLGANRPSKVLLIHGHAKDRIELEKWLQHQELADPVVMGQQFTAGQTLPEKFEALANEADAAIALATPDDLASTASRADVTRARARQNVWVEVGWFWGRLGRSRVLLLVRGDVEIPSDLDGIEYHSYQQSVLELEPRIQSFLLQIGKRNQ